MATETFINGWENDIYYESEIDFFIIQCWNLYYNQMLNTSYLYFKQSLRLLSLNNHMQHQLK